MKLTQEELALLLSILNQTNVSGVDAKALVVAIMRKLEKQVDAPK